MDFFSGNLKGFRNIFGLTQEQLAKALSVEYRTIVAYETGKRIPPVNTLLQIARFYGISFDFLILNERCLFPKNIKLLRLAKTIDNDIYSDARNSFEGMVKAMWSKTLNTEAAFKQDYPEINLNNSFHNNLKDLRNHKNMTQPQLAELIGVSRSLLSQYEAGSFPSIERIIKLSEIFGLSLHALVSGEKLAFDFDDKYFGKIILAADQQLPFDEHKTLINLLEATINNKKQMESALNPKNLISA
jgi:putative transcriptional regulator